MACLMYQIYNVYVTITIRVVCNYYRADVYSDVLSAYCYIVCRPILLFAQISFMSKMCVCIYVCM